MLNGEVTYLQSQSMRSNLLFSNIPEVAPGVNEDAEAVVNVFLVETMKVAKEAVRGGRSNGNGEGSQNRTEAAL